MINMNENMSNEMLKNIEQGDYLNNEDIDTACARRILSICRDYGDDGLDAHNLLRMAFDKLEIFY